MHSACARASSLKSHINIHNINKDTSGGSEASIMAVKPPDVPKLPTWSWYSCNDFVFADLGLGLGLGLTLNIESGSLNKLQDRSRRVPVSKSTFSYVTLVEEQEAGHRQLGQHQQEQENEKLKAKSWEFRRVQKSRFLQKQWQQKPCIWVKNPVNGSF